MYKDLYYFFILQNQKQGKIKTESGVWIPATYKSNRYAQWKERTKAEENEDNDGEDDASKQKFKGVLTYISFRLCSITVVCQ